jgi:hypothetical protein
MTTTPWPLGFGVGEEQGRQWWGSGDCAKGVSFPPLRASGKRSRSSLRLSPVNLGSCASYRHSGRGPLPTDPVVTPPFKALTGEASGTRSLTEPSALRSTQHLVDVAHFFSFLYLWLFCIAIKDVFRSINQITRGINDQMNVVWLALQEASSAVYVWQSLSETVIIVLVEN